MTRLLILEERKIYSKVQDRSDSLYVVETSWSIAIIHLIDNESRLESQIRLEIQYGSQNRGTQILYGSQNRGTQILYDNPMLRDKRTRGSLHNMRKPVLLSHECQSYCNRYNC